MLTKRASIVARQTLGDTHQKGVGRGGTNPPCHRNHNLLTRAPGHQGTSSLTHPCTHPSNPPTPAIHPPDASLPRKKYKVSEPGSGTVYSPPPSCPCRHMDQGPTSVLYHSFGAREASRLIITHSLAHPSYLTIISHIRWRPRAGTCSSDSGFDYDSFSRRGTGSDGSNGSDTSTPIPHHTLIPPVQAEGHKLLHFGASKPAPRLARLEDFRLFMWLSTHCASRSPPSLRDMVGSCVSFESPPCRPLALWDLQQTIRLSRCSCSPPSARRDDTARMTG